MVVRSLVASLVASAALLVWAPNASAELVMVRVVGENVMVKTRPSRLAETLAKPQADTVLEVLSREGAWFWVLVERDSHGTQRAGWVRESDVEFLDSAVARFFPAPIAPPVRNEPAVEEGAAEAAVVEAAPAEAALTDAVIAEAASAAATASAAEAKLKAEESPVAETKAVRVAKVEKPKKVDDRKLRKAAAEYEKALQAYEQLQFKSLLSDQPLLPVGEPIVEPLYSLPN
jgi:hypothetical protein